MDLFGSSPAQAMDRSSEGRRQASGGAGRWDIDLTSRSDSALTKSHSTDCGLNSLELYDSRSDSGGDQAGGKNFYLELQLFLRAIEQFIQALRTLLSESHSNGSDTPVTKPTSGNDHPSGSGNEVPTAPSDSGHQSDPAKGSLADTGIRRGRTIYHDDFNGAKGEMPNQSVFDTAHIGPEGQTRQRGKSIHEDAIISQKDTVMDGEGHLQLFPTKEKTYDPVAKEYVDYTKGSMNTGKGLHFNLKDYPNGLAIEVRAKHPTAPGAKFDGLWIMTDRWAADPSKGEKSGDTVEYDAAEGGGADITVHYPMKDSSGQSKDHYGGGHHPTDVKIDDGQFHTYTVVIKPNKETGRGDVVEYIDGKQEFAKESVFPGDKDLHLRSSLEVSPQWTHKTYTGDGGMNSTGAGVIDYFDVSELAH